VSDQIVWVDEEGFELDEEEVTERMRDIHESEYADWGGWSTQDSEGLT
jgi:hypothetical protein